MTLILVPILSLITIVCSKFFLQKWFNHVALYAAIWGTVVSLYELKLMNYIEISGFTWGLISYCFFAFILGVTVVIAARNNFTQVQTKSVTLLITEAENLRILRNVTCFFAVLGIISVLQHWYILIGKFGNIQMVLIQANLVYKLRTEGEISGVLPYLYITSYVAVVLSSVYSAIKKKVTFLSIISFLAVILKEIASFGRAGILMGFLLFIVSFILYRHALSMTTYKKKQKFSTKDIIVLSSVMLILFISGITVVKSFRGTYESFKASTKTLSKVRNNEIISPSIYLYASAHVGVLSKYFDGDGEKVGFGQNSFLPIYNFISKFGVMDHPDFYQKGYWIPMWTNTGTYIREIHADFGLVGVIIFPFLLGMVTTFFWFRFLNHGRLFDFVILVYLYLIISMSFLVMISRSAAWLLSLIALLVVAVVLEKLMNIKAVEFPESQNKLIINDI